MLFRFILLFLLPFQGALSWSESSKNPGEPGELFDLFRCNARVLLEVDPKDFQRLFEHWNSFQDMDSERIHALTFMYRYGRGVKEDRAKALEYYKSLADLKDPAALYNLAALNDEGILVERDRGKAQRLAEQSARLGSPYGEYLLAYKHIYDSISAGDDEEILKLRELQLKKAFNLLKSANKKADCLAEVLLAKAYSQGSGVEPDQDKALELLEKAAKRGHARAVLDLAVMLYNKEDYASAAAWFLVALYQAIGEKSFFSEKGFLFVGIDAEQLSHLNEIITIAGRHLELLAQKTFQNVDIKALAIQRLQEIDSLTYSKHKDLLDFLNLEISSKKGFIERKASK